MVGAIFLSLLVDFLFLKMKKEFLRFSHIPEQIFKKVDNASLIKCRELSQLWQNMMNAQRYFLIQKEQTNYSQELIKKYLIENKHGDFSGKSNSKSKVLYFIGQSCASLFVCTNPQSNSIPKQTHDASNRKRKCKFSGRIQTNKRVGKKEVHADILFQTKTCMHSLPFQSLLVTKYLITILTTANLIE